MIKKILVILIIITVFVVVIFYFYISSLKSKSSISFPRPQTHTRYGITYESTYERYDKIVEKAADSKNPDICDEINFGQDHGDYTSPVGISRYFCRADYAVKTLDIQYCKSLDSEMKFAGTISQRNKCLIEIAKKLNNVSLCEFLSNKNYCPIK